MANLVEHKNQRQHRIALYKSVNALFEEVQNSCEGVYFEIVVENRDQILRRFVINQRNENYEMAADEDEDNDEDPVLRERLFRIERLQKNYKNLMDTMYDMYYQIKDEFEDENNKLRVIQRKGAVRRIPRLEIETDSEDDDNDEEFENEEFNQENDNFRIDEENSDFDIESNFNELSSDDDEDNWSDPDSGLDSEAEVQLEFDADSPEQSEIESDPESGLE